MILNMYAPTIYPCSPRSSRKPQLGQRSPMRNQESNKGPPPQFGQRRRNARAVSVTMRWRLM
jgi:hypothetical protein